jgi:tetratricopeptide (TPR) repeat protein
LTVYGLFVHCVTKTAVLLKPIVCCRQAWSGFCPVRRYTVLGTVLLALFCTAAGAENLSKDQRQWWIDRYGQIDARSEPLVVRAEEIFNRVAAAADKMGNRWPKLVVIGGKGDPYALTLRDGTVILTLEGLKICYRDATQEVGDSRLAFLIGHELAHLAKDDFWHVNAFVAVSSYKDDAKVRRILTRQLKRTGGSLAFVRTQELQADSYGIIYMTMAGYDPKAIIGSDSTSFFHYWVSQITGKLAYSDAAHVSPEARAEFVRTELRPVIAALDRFDRGVQLYRSGNYKEAASFFESFIEKYPGREVYNNLGLSHYQLAMKALSECDEQLPVYFKLPMVLDSETSARKLRETAAEEGAACIQDETYQTSLQEAIRYFEEAEKKEVAYLPARINLSTALIMSGDYAKAISVANEALKVDPKSPEALNNKAVAEYLFGKQNNAENPNALATLKSISNTSGDASPSDRSLDVPSQDAPAGKGLLRAGLSIDPYNLSFGPSIVWWTAGYVGFQASYGQGTYTTYSIRGLARYGEIDGMTLYAGIGLLGVERKASLLGVATRFSDRSGEIVAGVMLPISKRLKLLTAVTANNIKLEKTVAPNEQEVPLSVDYNPISVTVTLVY